MTFKNFLIPSAILLIFVISSCSKKQTIVDKSKPPTDPTVVKMDMEDGSTKDLKKNWLNLLFQTPDGRDYKDIEAENAWNLYQERLTIAPTKDPKESLADGKITGEWIERGSDNQAGSVFKTEFDVETKEIYTISAGGSLFKGNIAGDKWQVINDRLRFDARFLEMVVLENGTKRLLSSISRVPHYSDDGGKTWIKSDGFNAKGSSRIKNAFASVDSLGYIYFLGKEEFNQNISLYQSKDQGKTYKAIWTSNVNLLNVFAVNQAKNSNEIYVIEQLSANTSRLHKMNATQTELEILENELPLSFEDGNANLISTKFDDKTYMYLYTYNSNIYKSEDEGKTWENVGKTPDGRPWGVGMFVSSEDPNYLITGHVECFRSYDGGKNWSLFNKWYDYYADVVNKMHADFMHFEEIHDTIENKKYVLISNHGGLNRLDELDGETVNIGLEGLNVAQYYSVRTSKDEKFIFAGSQDQGYQRTQDNKEGVLDFQQVISGDYGHIVFSNNGKSMWMVYPGGYLNYYETLTGPIKYTYSINSENETVWIPPLASSSNETSKGIFMAGGSITGGKGSYLITVYPSAGKLEVDQYDFDFLAKSGGTISAIALAGEYDDIIYVATTSGKFYTSTDYGDSFQEATSYVGGHYLYGGKIIPSKLYSEVIYTGGTGYNGVPMMRSIDGGKTFNTFAEGLPNTTVLDLAINSDESLLFAATSAGPYVCIISEEQWYPMHGENAPNVVNWSVEMVNDNKVRFGTYARGIFDFEIDYFVSNEDVAVDKNEINVYPNPVRDILNIDWGQSANKANLYNFEGKLIQTIHKNGAKTSQVDVSTLPTGSYILQYESNGKVENKKIVKL